MAHLPIDDDPPQDVVDEFEQELDTFAESYKARMRGAMTSEAPGEASGITLVKLPADGETKAP